MGTTRVGFFIEGLQSFAIVFVRSSRGGAINSIQHQAGSEALSAHPVDVAGMLDSAASRQTLRLPGACSPRHRWDSELHTPAGCARTRRSWPRSGPSFRGSGTRVYIPTSSPRAYVRSDRNSLPW